MRRLRGVAQVRMCTGVPEPNGHGTQRGRRSREAGRLPCCTLIVRPLGRATPAPGGAVAHVHRLSCAKRSWCRTRLETLAPRSGGWAARVHMGRTAACSSQAATFALPVCTCVHARRHGASSAPSPFAHVHMSGWTHSGPRRFVRLMRGPRSALKSTCAQVQMSMVRKTHGKKCPNLTDTTRGLGLRASTRAHVHACASCLE